MALTQVSTDGLTTDAVTEMTQKPEFYGFKIDSSGNLIVETTGLGNDSITDTTVYKEYDINIQNITYQLSNGNLLMIVN
jgi:hypothetical protein